MLEITRVLQTERNCRKIVGDNLCVLALCMTLIPWEIFDWWTKTRATFDLLPLDPKTCRVTMTLCQPSWILRDCSFGNAPLWIFFVRSREGLMVICNEECGCACQNKRGRKMYGHSINKKTWCHFPVTDLFRRWMSYSCTNIVRVVTSPSIITPPYSGVRTRDQGPTLPPAPHTHTYHNREMFILHWSSVSDKYSGFPIYLKTAYLSNMFIQQ